MQPCLRSQPKFAGLRVVFQDDPAGAVDQPHDVLRGGVIRRRVFTHHGRVAGSFRGGRRLIAGDAAHHLMPVWMGQGWSSGMRDGTNLGWKLSTVLRGAAGDALLDTYTSERKDHAKAMVDLSLTLGSVIKLTTRSPSPPATLLLPC